MILFTISLLLILSLGYTFSQEVHITKTETMELTTSYSNIICYGQPTKIQSSVNGGREPYIYTYFKLNGYNNDTIYISTHPFPKSKPNDFDFFSDDFTLVDHLHLNTCHSPDLRAYIGHNILYIRIKV